MSSFLNDAFTSPGKTHQSSIIFTVLSDEQLKINLLQIRRLTYRSRARARIDGPLFQKGRREAKSGAERVRATVEDALKLSKWKFPPREGGGQFCLLLRGESRAGPAQPREMLP